MCQNRYLRVNSSVLATFKRIRETFFLSLFWFDPFINLLLLRILDFARMFVFTSVFSVHYLLIIFEWWRKQKAKDKQAPIELENIPAVRQTQIGWVCSQKSSQEREQRLLLQEKGQLVSEATSLASKARGHMNRGSKAWERNLEKIAPWKLCTHEQTAPFRGQERALTGCHVQAWDGWDTTVPC